MDTTLILALEGIAARLWRKSAEAGKKFNRLATRLHRGAVFGHKDDVCLTDMVRDLRELASQLEDVAGRLHFELGTDDDTRRHQQHPGRNP